MPESDSDTVDLEGQSGSQETCASIGTKVPACRHDGGHVPRITSTSDSPANGPVPASQFAALCNRK